ncbi:MAG: carbohydrate ABC transporter permease [Syntrophomonas sp.]
MSRSLLLSPFEAKVNKNKSRTAKAGAIITLSLFVVLFTFPMIFTVANSFMSNAEISESYPSNANLSDEQPSLANAYMRFKLIPEEVTLRQYYTVLVLNTQYLVMFWNSIKIVVPIVLGQLLVSCMAAYGFSILKSKWSDYLFFLYIIIMLMPFQVTLVPNYIVASKMGLIGSHLSIVLPGVFNTFGVFLLRQYMTGIHGAYIEAARMDGANHWQVFRHVIIPMSKTGIAALAILTFIDNWNMVEQPLIFIKEAIKQPLSIYLATLTDKARGIAFAASVFYMLPMLLSFMYWEDYLVEGIQLSGIKA